MTASTQLEKLSNNIADLIVKLVNDTDGPVTLARVDRDVPGFATKEPPNWGYVIKDSGTEQLVWNGMSEPGHLALRKIIFERRVAIQLVNVLPYLLEDCVLYDDDWMPTMLLPAKAANLAAPRRLVRISERYRKAIMAKAAAKGTPGYRALVPASMRFTADRFSP